VLSVAPDQGQAMIAEAGYHLALRRAMIAEAA
jgi:hypothetical protein